MKRLTCLLFRSVCITLVLATFGSLAFIAWHFEPTRAGTSAEYWEYLCGVQLPGFKGHHEYSHFGGVYPVVEGRAYYYAQMHHESLLYSAPADEVLHDLPRVQEALDHPQPPPASTCVGYDSLCDLYKKGSERRTGCATYFGGSKVGAMNFQELEALRVNEAKASSFPPYDERQDAEFRGRLERAQRAWATFAFEAIYIAAWLIFVVGMRPLRVVWHWRVVLAPFLLFLPFFLGYAPMTFTFGPSGGFVYPIYLILASLPMQIVSCSNLDGVVWEHLPNVLAGLSQLPGSPLAATGLGCVGPVSSLAFGVLLLASVSVVVYFGRRLNRGQSRAVS